MNTYGCFIRRSYLSGAAKLPSSPVNFFRQRQSHRLYRPPRLNVAVLSLFSHDKLRRSTRIARNIGRPLFWRQQNSSPMFFTESQRLTISNIAPVDITVTALFTPNPIRAADGFARGIGVFSGRYEQSVSCRLAASAVNRQRFSQARILRMSEYHAALSPRRDDHASRHLRVPDQFIAYRAAFQKAARHNVFASSIASCGSCDTCALAG